MKILAIGDFHGKFPRKFEKLIKKEKIDVILSNGDYTPFSLRKIYFNKVYMEQEEKNLWEVIGKEKYKRVVLRDLKNGEKILKKLNSFGIPVFTVFGNVDYPYGDDITDYSKKEMRRWRWKWERERSWFYPRVLKKYKNIKRVDYLYAHFGEYLIIGGRGHSAPGSVKSRGYRKYKRKLDKLFKKFKDNKIIFLTHNMLYKTKLDFITSKKAHKHAQRKHVGSKMFRRIVEKYHPILQVGGHIDEGMGKQKIGRTWTVNCGPAHEGKAAIIELDKGKVKKVKFIR